MQWVYYLFKSAFILLGLIIILIGKFLSSRIILSKKSKYKVTNEEKYIKSCRMMFYCWGLYYVLFGCILLFINGWPLFIGIFIIMIPLLIIVVFSLNSRKYIMPVNELKNKLKP